MTPGRRLLQPGPSADVSYLPLAMSRSGTVPVSMPTSDSSPAFWTRLKPLRQ